ncbi:hypothetical protein KDE13_08165 [Campylobacter sp. faydin G-140]|nr:hypothetical protein [Campylobacter anatolicus]MBR8466306.1 hypothetical protein [Campylobacter anatolicus]
MRVENFRNDFTKVAKIGVKVALLSVVMQEIYSKKIHIIQIVHFISK